MVMHQRETNSRACGRSPGDRAPACWPWSGARSALLAAAQRRAGRRPSAPNFVVIQTDDQTLDQLYASTRRPAGATIRAMPNTLEADRRARRHLQALLRLLLALLPVAGHPADRRYAHNHDVRGNVPPTGATPASPRAAFNHNLAVWLQGAGYRTIHVGKFLNGYGDPPYDNGKTVPPGWSAWHSVLQRGHPPLLLRLQDERQRYDQRPVWRHRHSSTRNYGSATTPDAPITPPTASPQLRDRLTSLRSAPGRDVGHTRRANPSTSRSTTPPRTATSATRPGPSRRRATTTRWVGANFPRWDRAQGFDEATCATSPSFIRNAPKLTLGRDPHLPRLLPEVPGVAALDRLRA